MWAPLPMDVLVCYAVFRFLFTRKSHLLRPLSFHERSWIVKFTIISAPNRQEGFQSTKFVQIPNIYEDSFKVGGGGFGSPQNLPGSATVKKPHFIHHIHYINVPDLTSAAYLDLYKLTARSILLLYDTREDEFAILKFLDSNISVYPVYGVCML